MNVNENFLQKNIGIFKYLKYEYIANRLQYRSNFSKNSLTLEFIQNEEGISVKIWTTVKFLRD